MIKTVVITEKEVITLIETYTPPGPISPYKIPATAGANKEVTPIKAPSRAIPLLINLCGKICGMIVCLEGAKKAQPTPCSEAAMNKCCQMIISLMIKIATAIAINVEEICPT